MKKYVEELEKQNEELQERLANAERFLMTWTEENEVLQFGLKNYVIAYINKIGKSKWRAVLNNGFKAVNPMAVNYWDFKSKKEATQWVEDILTKK
jgi:hypothetical protein